MQSIKELQQDMVVTGIVPGKKCTIIRIKPQSDYSIKVTYESDEETNNIILTDKQMPKINEVTGNGQMWDFTVDPILYKLMSEAMRIRNASQFDPYMAVYTSKIQPLPHQITAVYETMLPRHPLRFILADDPGAGKTIMAGLYIKELMLREDLKRCMIVAPGNLTEQWQEELHNKFNLDFNIVTNDAIKQSCDRSNNLFNQKYMNLCIARIDSLKNPNKELFRWIKKAKEFDLIVCDEAHKMSAHWDRDSVKGNQRYNLGKILSRNCRNFLLMTATPHNGKDDEFELFLSLVDHDRFAEIKPKYYDANYGWQEDIETDDDDDEETIDDELESQDVEDMDDEYDENTDDLDVEEQAYPNRKFTRTICEQDVHDVMRRLIKEDLRTFDGKPLFPDRYAFTLSYSLTNEELLLYEYVTEYVRTQFNRAEVKSGKKKNAVGFALTILQRRLASSPAAIYSSLQRRRKRLSERYNELKFKKKNINLYKDESGREYQADWNEDNYTADELETTEEIIVDNASAAENLEELQQEIEILKGLENIAQIVLNNKTDRKWTELRNVFLQNQLMFANGKREKLIIFTEHRDTLNYLKERISELIGESAIVIIHGGTPHDERHQAEESFKHNPDVLVMIATDAAGEGINLQRAHLMINYDLPWNPNRLEQRFGRIHRIGQKNICYMWNLVAEQTREGKVYQQLLKKLDAERERFGGKVFDVLGKVKFDNMPLRDIILKAIRNGDDQIEMAKVERSIDEAMNIENIKRLLAENALLRDMYDPGMIAKTREDMERNYAKRLQPHYIEDFFRQSFTALGGEMRKREQRYEIRCVPDNLRRFAHEHEIELPKKYESICFETELVENENGIDSELICPGNGLFDMTLKAFTEQNGEIFERGTILINPESMDDSPKLLIYAETEIQNGFKQCIFKKTHFVYIDHNRQISQAGNVPYLDCRIPRIDEYELLKSEIEKINWINDLDKDIICGFVNDKIYSDLYKEESNKYESAIERRKSAICERLSVSIKYYEERSNYWKYRYRKAAKKKTPKTQMTTCLNKAKELNDQLNRRLAELDCEKQCLMVPVRLKGYALVVPYRMMQNLAGHPIQQAEVDAKKTIELMGMKAVMEIERSLGNHPRDVSDNNCGFDIESKCGDINADHVFRFIEVKSRRFDAKTITITKNEILTARNSPEQYIFAVVLVDGNKTSTTYYKNLNFKDPDDSMCSINYDIKELKKLGHIDEEIIEKNN